MTLGTQATDGYATKQSTSALAKGVDDVWGLGRDIISS
jgi:hypothetical protein